MDTTSIQQKRLDEAFENLPKEVEDFMWSDAYTIIIDAIQKSFDLNDEQKELVRKNSYELLLGLKTMPEIAEDFTVNGITPETSAKILYAIDSEIVTRAENITEFYTLSEEDAEFLKGVDREMGNKAEASVGEAVEEDNSPDDVLATLESRLKSSSVIAPVSKSSSPQDISRKEAPKSRITDLYREKPD